MTPWREVTDEVVAYGFYECEAAVDCDCGRSDLRVGDGEPVTCPGCGREYRLTGVFEVREPDTGKQGS